MKTFEDYLKTKHAESYTGLDDYMPDAFDNWVSQLDADEVIQYAEDCVKDLQGTETFKEQYERVRMKK